MQEEEKIIDIKGTLEQFVKADEPEMSQEEAIMKFGETKKKKFNSDDADDADTTEEQEHLQRIKQELLASLERVKKLEQQIYRDSVPKDRLKLKNDSNGGFSKGRTLQEKQTEQMQQENQKERE